MRHMFSIAMGLLICTTLAEASDVNDSKSIHAERAAFNEAIAQHDLESMRSFLSEDYVITISTGTIERSRDEHIDSFASHFEEFPDVVYVRSPTEIRVSDAYPLAIERGNWTGTRTTDNGSLENGGEYTAAWKRTNQGWSIYSELFVALYCRGEDC